MVNILNSPSFCIIISRYVQGVVPWIHRGLSRNIYVPNLVILHPPVASFHLTSTAAVAATASSSSSLLLPSTVMSNSGKGGSGSSSKKGNKDHSHSLSILPDRKIVTNIAILSPQFFTGDDSIAFKLLASLQAVSKVISTPIHYYFIGKIVAASAAVVVEFLDRFQNSTNFLNAELGGGNRRFEITFLDGIPSDKIAEALTKCAIVWYPAFINELDTRPDDPAKVEVFPTPILDGMFAGCIPILPNLGGAIDVVTHGYSGMLAEASSDFVSL